MGYRGIKEINKIEEKFDMVIHAASPSSGIAYNRNKEGTIFINSIVIDSLFKLLNKTQASTFLFFSTSGIYGIHPNNSYPLGEKTVSTLDHLNLKNIYLLSKLAGETLLNTLSETNGKEDFNIETEY